LLQLVRRYRIPALFCALAVFLCELVARPYTTMGISDDGPYILIAQKLAATGHIAYNGWSAAMLLWQLYLGAAFIKLFGFSYTTVRMSTLLVAAVLAFFLQRTMVRASISERNATIGTLALVLSPLYLLLSVTFMSDIHGLFAIVLCLYGCLRALQAATPRAAIGWLCFALATNGICGTSRQLAWLGILVMVPCTLWLLRAQRRVLFAGAAANLAGVLFILGCMIWLKHQPYTTPEKFYVSNVPLGYITQLFLRFAFELPFLLLPLAVMFIPELRKASGRLLIFLVPLILLYAAVVAHLKRLPYLEPSLRDSPGCNWVTIFGEYESVTHGIPHIFLHTSVQILLTLSCMCGLLGLIVSFYHPRSKESLGDTLHSLTYQKLSVLLAPFSVAYIALLIFRCASVANDNTGVLFDRYALGLLLAAAIFLVRYYQDRIHPVLPLSGVIVIAIVAAYGVIVTHNTFALYRARVEIADELRLAGVPYTATDNGWEFNIGVQLEHTNYINNPGIVSPAHAYVPPPPLAAGTCSMIYHDETPTVRPLYGVSFDPTACYGPAPFMPVHYSRWLASTPGNLYVVRYLPSSKP
jgi:Dolichyl-phosphate-mannose-protein mannosyltransferase